MRTRNAIANDIVRAFDRLAEKHGANIPMGDLGALIYLVESELDGVRAEALAPPAPQEKEDTKDTATRVDVVPLDRPMGSTASSHEAKSS